METIQQCRDAHRKVKSGNGRIAVIVQNDNHLGVQFWTEQMITEGKATNTDKSISLFVERLTSPNNTPEQPQ